MRDLPDSTAIANANDTSTTLSAMIYCKDTLRVKLEKARATEEYKPIINAMEESYKVVCARDEMRQSISGKVWEGKATEEELQMLIGENLNFMDIRAMENIHKLNETLGVDHAVSNINIVYYVDENAQFNRGYIVNNAVVDETNETHQKMLEVIDEMFHSWLVSHRMASDASGVIHLRKSNGDLGEKVRPEELKQLLEDPKTGFQMTVKKIDPKIELNMTWTPPESPVATPNQSAAAGG